MNNGMKIIFYSIVIIVLFIVLVRYLESTSIFYPDKILTATPQALGLAYEDVFIQTEDQVIIHGWLIRSPTAKSTLIFFHGNAGNIGDRLEKIDFFHALGLNMLIIDYRGYGKSEGNPTEQGIYKDATAAYDYLTSRSDMRGQKYISYGDSLGGAVAVDLAAKRAIACLIVDSTFSSAADMAKKIYPFVPSFLIQTKMDSMGKIRSITVPKLFIHSVEDEIVPFALGKKLYDAAPDPKQFIEIVGTHNDGHVYDQDKIKSRMTAFLKNWSLM